MNSGEEEEIRGMAMFRECASFGEDIPGDRSASILAG
jgi:hypothetical protein